MVMVRNIKYIVILYFKTSKTAYSTIIQYLILFCDSVSELVP